MSQSVLLSFHTHSFTNGHISVSRSLAGGWESKHDLPIGRRPLFPLSYSRPCAITTHCGWVWACVCLRTWVFCWDVCTCWSGVSFIIYNTSLKLQSPIRKNTISMVWKIQNRKEKAKKKIHWFLHLLCFTADCTNPKCFMVMLSCGCWMEMESKTQMLARRQEAAG